MIWLRHCFWLLRKQSLKLQLINVKFSQNEERMERILCKLYDNGTVRVSRSKRNGNHTENQLFQNYERQSGNRERVMYLQLALAVKNSPANARNVRDRVNLCVRKIPWKREWQPTPVFLPGVSHGQRSLADYSPQGHTESDTTEVTQHACKHKISQT